MVIFHFLLFYFAFNYKVGQYQKTLNKLLIISRLSSIVNDKITYFACHYILILDVLLCGQGFKDALRKRQC